MVSRPENDKFYRSGKQITFEWSEDTALNEDDEESSDAAQATPAVKLDKRYSSSTISSLNLFDERLIPYELITRLLETICFENQDYLAYSPAILIFMPGLNEIRRLHDLLTEHQIFGNADTFRLYPLHSSISSENQGAVFDIPPFGVRKIVIGSFLSCLCDIHWLN
jgi:ATP-dependent RNA helicase DHX29